MQPIKYYLSLEKTNTNNKLMILGIIEIVYIPLVILTLFFQETKPESNFNQFTYSRCIYLSTI